MWLAQRQYGVSWQVVPHDIEKMIQTKIQKNLTESCKRLEHGQIGHRYFKAAYKGF